MSQQTNRLKKLKSRVKLQQDRAGGNTSAMEMVEPLIEETVLPYLVGIDCVTGKGEYGMSDSLPGLTFAANRVLGNEFVYACC